jgi:hypothetical protein
MRPDYEERTRVDVCLDVGLPTAPRAAAEVMLTRASADEGLPASATASLSTDGSLRVCAAALRPFSPAAGAAESALPGGAAG